MGGRSDEELKEYTGEIMGNMCTITMYAGGRVRSNAAYRVGQYMREDSTVRGTRILFLGRATGRGREGRERAERSVGAAHRGGGTSWVH